MEPVFLVSMAIVFFGSLLVNDQMTAKDNVKSQKQFIMDDGVYQCDQTQKLGVIPKPKTIILEKEVSKPCPKCKPKKAPCGDDRKIFPVCDGLK